MGPKRDGVWRETGILQKFPSNGPPVCWRVPVNRGYCGPAVANGRLFMLDRLQGTRAEPKPGERIDPAVPGSERVLCLDARTGQKIWEHSYECPYKIGYPSGPRATPTVEGDRVFTLGAMGDLLCLSAKTGDVIWQHHLLKEFAAGEPPTWGYAAHPLLDGNRLICLVGGSNSAVVAFEKNTGKVVWQALTAQEIGYAPPMIYEIAGRRQLIIWHPDAVVSLEPETGKPFWTQKYPVAGKLQRPEVTIATPRLGGDKLFFSSFYHGALLLQVTNHPPGALVAWDRHSTNHSSFTDGLHTVMCTPVWKGQYIYGICGEGELRCLDAISGDRVWESEEAVKPGLFGTAFFVEHGDDVFVWNDQGELVLGRLSPKGFTVASRAKLLETSENTRGRDIVWCAPAFADRCAFVQNGKELICISLSAAAGQG